MEKVCRRFLWGSSKEGGYKKSLVAWEEITRPKEDGGLGFIPVEQQAAALQMRHVSKLILEEKKEWTIYNCQ